MAKTEDGGADGGRGVRVELGAPLDGHWIQLDIDGITMGFVEDLQANNTRAVLDGLAACIVASDLHEEGQARTWLRSLRIAEFQAVSQALLTAMVAVPKAS